MPPLRREKYPTFLSRSRDPFVNVLGINGTLLYCARPPRGFHTPTYRTFYVVNIITREWKKLPARPMLSKDNFSLSFLVAGLSPILVRDTSLETYKLFVLHGHQGGNFSIHWYVHIYESTLDSWSTKNLVEGVARLHRAGEPYGSPVYLNGVLYTCTLTLTDDPLNDVIYLMTFNIEKGSFEELALPMNRVITGRGVRKVHLVVCYAKLMMIVTYCTPDAPCVLLHVLTVDVGSKQLLEVTSAPDALEIRNYYRVCSDGKCIFFEDMDGSMFAYNVHEDEWAFLSFPPPLAAADARRCPSVFFHPGLNPFAEV